MTLSRRSTLVLVVLLIAVPLVGAATAAPAAVQQQAEEADEYSYSLSELESSGDIREQDKQSLRVLGSMQYLWALDYKVGVNDAYGKTSSERWLSPGATINRNKFRLQGNFPYDGQARNYTAEVVYYQPETRQVQTENGTTTERYANISAVDTQDISFEPGIESNAEVSLRPHYSDATKVAVFLKNGGAQVAKWGPYTHKSVQTTAGVPFDTYGEFIPWLIKFFLVTTGVGAAISVGTGYKVATETGGFGKGLAWWGLVTAICGGTALFVWFAEIVYLIVAIPFLLAAPVIFGVFVVTVEVMQPAISARLEKPNITETESAVGGTRKHIEGEHADTIHVFERDEGLSFIKYGSIRAALARQFAGMAIIPWDRIEKRYKSSGTSSDTEKFYVKDYDFTPASWSYNFPDLIETTTNADGDTVRNVRTGLLAGAGTSVLFGYLVGGGMFEAPRIGAAIGLIPVIALGVESHRGDIDIEFADGAQVSAKAARLTETEERLQYESIDAAIEDIASARTDVWKQLQRIRQKVREEQDKTTDEMYDIADGNTNGGVDVDSDDDGAASEGAGDD